MPLMNLRILLLTLALAGVAPAPAAGKKIVFLAGRPSHPPGAHEHRAGCLLLQACLAGVPEVIPTVHTNGWPANESEAFNGASAIVVYSDGGGGHPLLAGDRLQTIAALVDQGVGFATIHYACQPTRNRGHDEFLAWIGGCYEENWSVNPIWTADFKELPPHPIARGVTPFSLEDEWYFHMRFRDGMRAVLPILSAVPPESTLQRPDGPHSGNPAVRDAVRRREPQAVMWAAERPGGGRGFGFTGGHFHRSWGDDNFRKVVLNAILWIAHVEVPEGGVVSIVTPEQLQANLDDKGPRR
jgi:type 1 glutamine amidotransferase